MPSESKQIHIQVLSSIDEVQSDEWNQLVQQQYPFLQHGFLNAMEQHACVGEHVGWIPRHLVYRDDAGKLLGAMPLYEKNNSWGEFVFDHAWADAYQRYGLEYYPKLINAIPFTPAMGQRFIAEDSQRERIANIMVSAVSTLAEENEYSGVHCLFPQSDDFEVLNCQGAVSRNDCQFHWHNRDYANFDDFLKSLKPKKRKNIKQERRKVEDAGITIRRLNGNTASSKDWLDFTRLYELIYNRKYGMPAFNQSFFMSVAQSFPEQVLLVLADAGQQCIAGALMYCDDTTLYGRHWGCDGYVDSLHFEVCYYQGIEFCINNGLKRFDPGAQGEHKVARGFEPTRTQSLHWLTSSPFNQAIRQFVEREQAGVQNYIDAIKSHSPFTEPTV